MCQLSVVCCLAFSDVGCLLIFVLFFVCCLLFVVRCLLLFAVRRVLSYVDGCLVFICVLFVLCSV